MACHSYSSTLTSRSLTVAAVLAAIVLHFGVESINPSDHPNLVLLNSFPLDNGNRINIAERIGVRYDDLGTFLLDDGYGTIMENIKYDHKYVKSRIDEVFRRWLSGRGIKPITWAVLVDRLRMIDLYVLADTIEHQFTNVQEAAKGTLASLPSTKNLDKHPIKKFLDFNSMFLPVSCDQWEQLCMALDVDKATVKDLKNYASPCYKKDFCVEEFFETGKATCERVMYVLASQPLNYVVPAKEIGRKYDIDYYAVMGVERQSFSRGANHQKIKNFNDLKYALSSVAHDSWEELGRSLGVDEATVTDLRRWKGTMIERWEFCLHDYLRYGIATWEHVMQAVAASPLNQVVMAKKIGKKYGIDYNGALGLEKPVHPDQSNHHKIRSFIDLKFDVLSIPYEDWEDICTLLNVDKTTLTDLKRLSDDKYNWEFCLEEYFKHGVSTWEDVMRAVASSPFNHIVTAKQIARKYGIDYYASMGLRKPTRFVHKKEHKINTLNQLQYAVMNIIPYADWEILCKQLNVDEALVTDLKRWGDINEKWKFCLQDYFDMGNATWENMIYAMASSPLNQIVMAKQIARDHGIKYQAVMDERRRRDEL